MNSKKKRDSRDRREERINCEKEKEEKGDKGVIHFFIHVVMYRKSKLNK